MFHDETFQCYNVLQKTIYFCSIKIMHSIHVKHTGSIFTPHEFICQFAPHLLSVQLPPYCIFSLIPHPERYIKKQPASSSKFLFESKFLHFKQPVPHVMIYGGMGAPIAGFSLEIAIELGIQNILIIGTCGLLDPKIKSGDTVVPSRFIREEGTSLHYVPPDEIIPTITHLNTIICQRLESYGVPCFQGLHWTTDAPFRETSDKIIRYRHEGCLSLDMESSALFAIAQYYHKKIAAILIGSDHLSDKEWNPPQPSYQRITTRIKEIVPLLPEIFQAF